MIKKQVCKPKWFGLKDGHDWKNLEEEETFLEAFRFCKTCGTKQSRSNDTDIFSLYVSPWIDVIIGEQKNENI